MKKLRKDLQAVLDKHGAHDFEFKVGNATYANDSVDFNVRMLRKGGMTPEMSALVPLLERYNLSVDSAQKPGAKLVGFNNSNRKYKFLYKDADGRGFKCDLSVAKALFRKAA